MWILGTITFLKEGEICAFHLPQIKELLLVQLSCSFSWCAGRRVPIEALGKCGDQLYHPPCLEIYDIIFQGRTKFYQLVP